MPLARSGTLSPDWGVHSAESECPTYEQARKRMRRTHVPLARSLMLVSCSLASQGESDSSEPSPISGNRWRIAGQAWAAPSCAFGDPACESPYFPLTPRSVSSGPGPIRSRPTPRQGVPPSTSNLAATRSVPQSLDDEEVRCPDALQLSAPPGYVVPVWMVCVGPD